jgi:hypothetical protein
MKQAVKISLNFATDSLTYNTHEPTKRRNTPITSRYAVELNVF